MVDELSDEEYIRVLIEQMGFSEEQARHFVAVGRGEFTDDVEVIDGPLSAEDKRRLGFGSIFDAPTRRGDTTPDTT